MNKPVRIEAQAARRPALIVTGDVDLSTPLPLTGQPTAALIKDAALKVYPGGPHGLMFTADVHLRGGAGGRHRGVRGRLAAAEAEPAQRPGEGRFENLQLLQVHGRQPGQNGLGLGRESQFHATAVTGRGGLGDKAAVHHA